MFAHKGMQPVIDAIIELAEHAAKEPFDFAAADDTDALQGEDRRPWSASDLPAAYKIVGKGERHATRSAAAKAKAIAALGKSDANPAGIDSNKLGAVFKELRSRRRPPRHPGDRHAHRRARPSTRSVRSSPRWACCRAPTARRCSPAARPRRWSSPRWAPATTSRSSTRSKASTTSSFMLHYNFPPFSVGETRPHGRAGPARDRPRQAGLARDPADAAERRGVPLHHPPGLRDHRVQRLVLDGHGLRPLAGADGRGRAAEDAGGRHRHGPDQGRRRLRRAVRHPGRRGPPGRHGLQGRRHRRRHHRPADGHQDRRHHRGDHEEGPRARRRTAACTSSARWPRRSTAPRAELGEYAPQDRDHEDPDRQDPRSHRHGRQGHPRDRRRDRRQDRHRRRRHGQDRGRRQRPRSKAAVDWIKSITSEPRSARSTTARW